MATTSKVDDIQSGRTSGHADADVDGVSAVLECYGSSVLLCSPLHSQLLKEIVTVLPAFLHPVIVGPVHAPALSYTSVAHARARRSPTGFLSRPWIGPMYTGAQDSGRYDGPADGPAEIDIQTA